MNRLLVMFVLLIAALLGFLPLFADNPVAEVVTLAPTTGVGTTSNTRDYATLELVRIDVYNSSAATSTVTVERVRSGRTNEVAAIALTAGAGSFVASNTVYVFKGDSLQFRNSTATGAVAEVIGKLHP